MIATADQPIPPFSRRRAVCHQEVQTEASFVPSCIDLKYTYEAQASEQYSNLRELREVIEKCLLEVGGSVYDLVNFKDIMLRMESEFSTNLPVTDVLLLSSKLFRRTSELGRLLGAFFGVVFADDHVDEHFKFMEVRILQQELSRVKKQLDETASEKANLEKLLSTVGQVALDHGKSVELLENHNQALQVQTSALEDQMALLFRQINTDLESNCQEAYGKVVREIHFQQQMDPARTTFRQTMDSLNEQIRSSRTLITEVRDTLLSCNQSERSGDAYVTVEPRVRFKLKMLDSNFQQLVARFTAVKDTVAETASELITALSERKKILYLSIQHIRLYDLQNAKIRHAKGILAELRQRTQNLLKKLPATFPSGSIASVDRLGLITAHQWKGGYTLAALRKNKNHVPSGVDFPRTLLGLSTEETMAAESGLMSSSVSNAFVEGAGTSSLCHNWAMNSCDTLDAPGLLCDNLGCDNPLQRGELPRSRNPLASDSNSACANNFSSMSRSGLCVSGMAMSDIEGPSGDAALHGRGVLLTDDVSTAIPFECVHDILELVRTIDADAEQLNGALTLEDEMSAFLKTLTLSVPSTARADVDYGALSTDATAASRLESTFEQALLPTGSSSVFRQRSRASLLASRAGDEMESQVSSRRGTTSSSKLVVSERPVSMLEKQHSDALLAHQGQQLHRLQEQISNMQEDFSSRLGFLRQVYEARITDLEAKESSAKRVLCFPDGEQASQGRASGRSGGAGPDSRNTPGALRHLTGVSSSPSKGAMERHGGDVPFAPTQDDREKLLTARGDWKKAKPNLQKSKKFRNATLGAMEKLDRKSNES